MTKKDDKLEHLRKLRAEGLAKSNSEDRCRACGDLARLRSARGDRAKQRLCVGCYDAWRYSHKNDDGKRVFSKGERGRGIKRPWTSR